MLKIYNYALGVFNSHYVLQRYKTKKDKEIEGIDKKYLHAIEVVRDGTEVVQNLDFNESFIELSKLSFLNHDVGRFEQMLLIGSYSDYELMSLIGLNHGGLGKLVLENGLIEQEIPITRVFDQPIISVVDKHVDARFESKDLSIITSRIFKEIDAKNFFSKASDKEKQKVINVLTQITQDVDRLDIYNQILEGRWIPQKGNDPIDSKILKKFYNGEYLNIADIKKEGLWNSNVGELVRLSFVNQIRLLSVAKLIYEKNLILRMKELRKNSYTEEAFDFMQDKLKTMIDNSDGITIKKTL